MSANEHHYKEISIAMKKYIEDKYPADRKIKEVGTKGAPSRFSDHDLIEIALEVKKVLRGESVNPNKLEKITGIGRQTWARRVNKEIDEMNAPVIKGRDLGLESDDEIFHTNISYIVEKYGDNPKKLISHLYHIEESRIRFFDQIQGLQKEIQALEKFKKELLKLKEENAILKQKCSHYEQQYNALVISSYFPELRKEIGAKENVLNISRSTRLDNMNSLFAVNPEVAVTTEVGIEKDKRLSNEIANELLNDINGLFEDK